MVPPACCNVVEKLRASGNVRAVARGESCAPPRAAKSGWILVVQCRKTSSPMARCGVHAHFSQSISTCFTFSTCRAQSIHVWCNNITATNLAKVQVLQVLPVTVLLCLLSTALQKQISAQ